MSDRARRGVLPFVIALGGHRDLRAEDVPGLVLLHRDRPVTVPGTK
jgi:hypothetical protein